jgi:hypothetical protein
VLRKLVISRGQTGEVALYSLRCRLRGYERRRPPPAIRSRLDLGYRIAGQSVELFEIRPQWDRPEIKRESALAKATFVRTRNVRSAHCGRRRRAADRESDPPPGHRFGPTG